MPRYRRDIYKGINAGPTKLQATRSATLLTRNAASSVWLVLSVLFPISDSQARLTLGVINRCSQSGLGFLGLTASLRSISWSPRILSHSRLLVTRSERGS